MCQVERPVHGLVPNSLGNSEGTKNQSEKVNNVAGGEEKPQILCPKELKTGIQTNPCIQMFMAALFTIPENGTNPSVH